MSKETKPEMTVEEFTERWCLKVIECMKGDDYIIHDKEECRADLNSVIRGKLIEFVMKELYIERDAAERIADNHMNENWIE